ncbi:MAG: hypothetical protein ABEI86_08335, partial [Halobacteriaceae archaeon]
MDRDTMPSKSNLIRILPVFLLFIIVVGFLLVFYFVIREFADLERSLAVEATSIAASTILTFGLIIVYRELHKTQQEQLEQMSDQASFMEKSAMMQESQKKWMEATHAPAFKLKYVTDSPSEDSNWGHVKVWNVGNGVAKNLQAYIEIKFISPSEANGQSGISNFVERPIQNRDLPKSEFDDIQPKMTSLTQ